MKSQHIIFFAIIIGMLFSLVDSANSLTETRFTFGNSVDTRLEVNASNVGDITAADMELLRKFTN
jgi:TM2 domain-containing membrane protein YozV